MWYGYRSRTMLWLLVASSALLKYPPLTTVDAARAPCTAWRRPHCYSLQPRTDARRAGELLCTSTFDRGLPSTPGWNRGELNQLTDWAVATEVNRPVICEYRADGFWLWTKWRGTDLPVSSSTPMFMKR